MNDPLFEKVFTTRPANAAAAPDDGHGRREIGWEGHTLKVVSPQGLILLKSFRRSGTDEDDIAHLRSIVDED